MLSHDDSSYLQYKSSIMYAVRVLSGFVGVCSRLVLSYQFADVITHACPNEGLLNRRWSLGMDV